ncbi:histidinol dehydrogenase [Legionella micdadei]|uniref:Histidinol dehydrogenase n=1 Tax=Legionella micdadei TaxID=451 RepID=A0A098GIC9_LEGMI|nr:histidinol dehydrogenase [Legionella micdadei]ARG97306.1 histidinol dehydrogenase [Legionella micdadei]ARH00387.1 histidinol dehydrogenase [Legionella micdadei]KTD28186.1 histidinol dehydrogenase [Legionella micdadei]NSL16815.1 histidinol dehydrogenase [Legionella micdadei]CEG61226.1 Histidinol dehydrogenase [Legionella micdadei]
MLTINDWQNLSLQERQQKLRRPEQAVSFREQVESIIQEVKTRGDEALFALTREYDRIDLVDLRVPSTAIKRAEISSNASIAINQAIETIRTYHQATMPYAKQVVTAQGVLIERTYRPISCVGLYVPGGNNTPLISSLLMQAIPAQVAGCPLRILCTPPNRDGEIDPHLLVAARLCGIDTIYRIGGAQAIAAMAYGTKTIPKMDKLFGPGNSYVTEAKTLVAGDPEGAAIDMPAGPSEVMIIADDEANPDFVAADLLAQAEHGIDSQAILICESLDFALKVQQKLAEQMMTLTRQDILKQALQHGTVLICTDTAEQIKIINNYAPEHLIINRRNAKELVPHITAAGTLFLGPWAAETMGDYVTGSNHVLPTNGYARNHSGLSTMDFLKALTVQSITKEGVQSLGEAAETLALIEGLDAHANAIKLRLNQLRGS